MLRDIVTAVRFETVDMRESIHRLRRVRTCDTRLLVDGPCRLVVTGDCLCRDFLSDMLVEADRFLVRHSGDALRNPPGAVRIHIRTRARDWTRQRRLEQGAQVRTDRIRDGAVAEQLPDPYHRAILEYLVQEAGSLAPLGSDVDLHRRLAELVAKEFGGGVEEHLRRVVACLPVIEAVGRGGRRVRVSPGSDELVTWWERYVERPLGRRERWDSVPLEDATVEQWARPAETDPGAVAVLIVMGVAARKAGAPHSHTLSEAVGEMVRCELLTEAAARRFLGDPGRVRDAAVQMNLLIAA